MKNVIILICTGTLFCLSNGKAQDRAMFFFEDLQQPADSVNGSLIIHQSPQVEKLVYRHLLEQANTKVQGYRISIYSGRGSKGREEWDKTFIRFISKYKIKIYKEFIYPRYLLYVGDFRTYSEAYKYLQLIEVDFKGAFVVGPRDIEVTNN